MTTTAAPADIAAPAGTAAPADTAPSGGAEAGTDSSLAPTARGLWRRSRRYLTFAAVLLLIGLVIAGLGDRSAYAPLDPRSGAKSGTLAAVRLLERQGITVRTVEGDAALTAALRERDTTVVIPRSDLLSTAQLGRLAATQRALGTRLVLIAPEQPALDAFTPGITSGDSVEPITPLTTPAGCSLPEATRAGSAELGGLTYRGRSSDTACYTRHGHATLIERTTSGDRDTIVLGTGHPLANRDLDQEGNASLTLGLLGARPHLVWYLPDYSAPSPSTERKSVTDYIPGGWYWAALQLTVAALLAAFWRARRLGPVVSERLPIVVRATETTEGRARLYQRANARGRAADALRRATRHRLAALLGVPLSSGEPDPTTLSAAVATRLARPATDVQHLLYGAPPTDDAALLRLTDDLDALERQARQP